jgi:predicted Co/Zn/Cd cation transporter (cation efflux family)
MSRPVLVRIHLVTAAGALAVISAFLLSSTVTELIGDPGEVRGLRHAILLALPLLIGCLAASALAGRRLAGRSRAPAVRRKQRRMQVVAALGLVVLVPCAVALNYLAGSAAAGGLASVWRSPSSWPAP